MPERHRDEQKKLQRQTKELSFVTLSCGLINACLPCNVAAISPNSQSSHVSEQFAVEPIRKEVETLDFNLAGVQDQL